jgi:hypothetical protein
VQHIRRIDHPKGRYLVNGIQMAVVAAAAVLLWAPSVDAQGSTAGPLPDGMEWTGFTCMNAPGCACPGDASPSFRATHCTAGGKIPFGNPLFTLIWGAGQLNLGGSELTGLPPVRAVALSSSSRY